MFTSLLLTASLTGGQPGANYYYPPGTMPGAMPRARQVVQPAAPGTLPMTTPAPMNGGTVYQYPPANGAGTNGTNGSGTNGASTSVTAVEEEKAEKEEEAPTRYLLERSLAETRLGQILDNRGIRIYGWTGMSANVSTASGSNLPSPRFDDRANEFLLNQNWLHIEKTLDTEKDEFQLGWNVDWILPGSDYRFTLPRGLWNGQLTSNNGGPELYGIDPYQFYLDAWLPNVGPQGTKLVFGRFQTHVGYELVQQVDTPFVSKSYLFQYNPFTHTGAWATTQLNDDWSVGNGFAVGIDNFIDPTNRFTYLGQLRWAPKDGDTTAAFNVVLTDPRYQEAEDFTLYNVYNFLLTHKFAEKLTYVLDTMYSHTSRTPFGYADWYGAANYLIYDFSERSAATLRAEVFNDTTGFRTGSEGLYTAVTAGFAWKPIPGLMLRPSVRFDHNGYTRPFEGDHSLWTGTMEAIVRW
jgi:hypothetical protein